MKKKYPSELNTKTVRVDNSDYILITKISQRDDVTFAQALHVALDRLGKIVAPEVDLGDSGRPGQRNPKRPGEKAAN